MSRAAYNALVAKAKAIYGDRLTDKDYISLAHKSSIAQIAAELKLSKRYGTLLKSVNETTVHRGQLEDLVEKEVFMTYMRLCSFLPHNMNGFNSFLIKKRELEIIINTIMFIHTGKTDAIIAYIPTYLVDYASFDLMELPNAKTFDELLRVLEGTYYEKILRTVLLASGKSNTDFDLEHITYELYLNYYEWLIKCINNEFKGTIRKQLYDSTIRQITIDNLLTAYRMKHFFARESSEILRLMMPYYSFVSLDEYHELLAASDDKILEFINRKYFRNKIDYDLNHLEIAVRQDTYNHYKKQLRISNDGTVVMYALVNALQIEKTNVTTIIEGTRYQLPEAEIVNMIIR